MRTAVCVMRICLLISSLRWTGRDAAADEVVDFERQVRPVLIARCGKCHGPLTQEGGLRLDVRQTALQGGVSGPVIVPGQAAASQLLLRITHADPQQRMPPEGPPVPALEAELLSRWIDAGAAWPETDYDREAAQDRRREHWAWQPVLPVTPPEIPDGTEIPDGSAAAMQDIDRFIVQRLAAQGLTLAPEAERATLMRRLSLTLLGLPPAPDELAEFVQQSDPAAWAQLVDRLLASPHYGERQARHWLDVVRFTESDGFEEDGQRPDAWPYRDYVIQSFNDDKPYAQFVREQIAGDVLPPVTGAGIAATGMLVAGPWDSIQRVTPSRIGRLQSREEQLEELVGAVCQTFLAVTVNCARCHDHKFDPVPQTDYYRVKAVFEGVDHGLEPRMHGTRRLLSPDEEAAWDAATEPLRMRIAALEQDMRMLEQQLRDVQGNAQRTAAVQASLDSSRSQLQSAREELQRQFPVVRAFVGAREQPQPTVLYVRGDVTQPGPVVTPGGLSLFDDLLPPLLLTQDSPEAERRRQFAEWLTHPQHPLTARVMVNRIWQQHFGTGLVDTPSDFGANGGRPSHPELLNWLAERFVQDGWSIKQLHRRILLSATWRQSAVLPPDAALRAASVDADNRLLWRFPSRPLEGEVVRDALLSLSGRLNRQLGGPSFRPFTTSRLNTWFYHLFDRDEPEFNRRTIYRMHVITGRSPFLDALDCPSPAVTMPRRRPTVTPLQALALMNDGFVLRQANVMAERVAQQTADPQEQVRLVFALTLARPPSASEQAASLAVVAEHGLPTLCWSVFNTSEFLCLP